MSDYTKVNLASVEDQAPKFGVQAQSFRALREDLGCEKTALSLQEIKPDARQEFGHRHADEEEIYVILSGSGRMRVEDDEIEVGELDAIRVAPAATRAFEAGSSGLRFVAFGAGAGKQDGEMRPGWWGDEAG